MKKLTSRSKEVVKKILVVDDHPLVVEAIAALFEKHSGLEICGHAARGADVLPMIKSISPDALILDLMLQDMNGLEMVKEIRAQEYNLPILVLSGNDESIYAERALRAGANGYLMKTQLIDQVFVAMKKVLSGEMYVGEKAMSQLLHNTAVVSNHVKTSPLKELSNRELEVLELIGRGYTSRQIADRWSRSIKTVDTYREKIKQKLNLSNATELIQFAVRWLEGCKI